MKEEFDALSDWEWQAELVARRLPAYTSTPSTRSSIAALVRPSLLAEDEDEWLSLLGSGFELRCFQLLSTTA